MFHCEGVLRESLAFGNLVHIVHKVTQNPFGSWGCHSLFEYTA